MKALVEQSGRVAEVRKDGDMPPMHPDLEWIECDASVRPGDTYDRETKTFLRPPQEPDRVKEKPDPLAEIRLRLDALETDIRLLEMRR